MCYKFFVLTVKKWLKLVYIYGSHCKNKTGAAFLDHSVYMSARNFLYFCISGACTAPKYSAFYNHCNIDMHSEYSVISVRNILFQLV